MQNKKIRRKLINESSLNEKVKTLATKEEIKALVTKTELKVEQDKIGKLGTHDSSYFLDKNDFGNDGFQNMFVYEPGLITFELKKDKSTDYVLSWKSKGVYTSKLKPLYTAFLHNINFSGYRMRIKLDKDPLTEEQNNYLTKAVNVYIVYDLDNW